MKNTNKSFDLLDSTSCKAFWFAARELNFTAAAELAGMTQSGISKHIAKLEEQLKTQLFTRVNKKVLLTKSGVILKNYLQNTWIEFDKINNLISAENFDFSGLVKYAMPESCLMSSHFSQLLQRREEKFSNIQLSVTVASNKKIEDLILDDQVDFGFLTRPSDQLRCIPFCMEDYVLVGRKNYSIKNKKDILNLSFIGFPELKNIFNSWSRTYFRDTLNFNEITVTNSMNDMRGVVTMLLEGNENDVTIMSRHCIESLMKERKLYPLNPQNKLAENQIYLAHLERELPVRVQKVKEEFFSILKSKN